MPQWWDMMRGRVGYQKEKENISGRAEELSGKLEESARKKGVNSEEFDKVCQQLVKVNNFAKQYVNDNTYEGLREAHAALGAACDAYLKKNKWSITGMGRERYGMVREVKRLHELETANGLLDKTVMKHLVGEGRTGDHKTFWNEVTADRRMVRAQSPREQVRVGAALNSRLMMEVEGEKGFFTADDTYMQQKVRIATKYDKREDMADENDRRIAGARDLWYSLLDEIPDEKARKTIKANQDRIYASMAGEGFITSYNTDPSKREVMGGEIQRYLGRAGLDSLEANEREGVVNALHGVMGQCARVINLADELKEAKIDVEKAGMLNRRNVLSSRFAEMVGNGQLFAAARPVLLDGNTPGSFMKFAKGDDLDKIGRPGGQNLLRINDYKNPQFLNQISNLEIIDWVTGQTDRHPKNMFYQVGETDPQTGRCPLTGIHAIDNDMAFGTIDGRRGQVKQQVHKDDIRYADADLVNALKVMEERPELIDNVFGDMLDESERNALKSRIGEMNKVLDKEDVQKLKIGDWEAKADEIADQMDHRYGYYQQAKGAIEEKKDLFRQPVQVEAQQAQAAAPARNGQHTWKAAQPSNQQKTGPSIGQIRQGGKTK